MNHLTWWDIPLRLIPEGLIFVTAGYAIARQKINWWRALITSIISALIVFGLKALPVHRFIPTALSGICMVILMIYINRLKVLQGIVSVLISFSILMLSEIINILLLDGFFQIDAVQWLTTSKPVMKFISGLPSLIIFGTTIFVLYRHRTRNLAAHNKNKKIVCMQISTPQKTNMEHYFTN